jgi:hypothetical protein
MNKFPLLIGGCPRSGTTALLQVLNSNVQVFISSEENLLSMQESFRKVLGTQERRKKSLAAGMRALSSRETLSLQNIHSHNFTVKAVWPAIRSIYKWHFSNLHSTGDIVLWGDKYPNYFRNIDEIANATNLRYLHLTRNPLDVINSMVRRTEMAKEGKDWWRAITDFDQMIETWASAYAAIATVEQRPNILHVHYEDMVFRFTETMAEINAFLGLALSFENPLISDPARHFDRQYLTPEMIEKILSHPLVTAYFKQHGDGMRRWKD